MYSLTNQLFSLKLILELKIRVGQTFQSSGLDPKHNHTYGNHLILEKIRSSQDSNSQPREKSLHRGLARRHQPKFLLLTTADGASPRRVALAIQSLTKTLEKYKMIVLVCEREESERDGERKRRRREVWRGRLVVLNLCCSCLEQKSNNKRI